MMGHHIACSLSLLCEDTEKAAIYKSESKHVGILILGFQPLTL